MKPRLRVLEFGIVALIPLLIFGTFFFAHFNRDWSVAADLEFLLAYNATLINAGTNQEYYDHPGFFTIYFLAFLIKLSRALGFTSISVIEDLNNFSPLFNGFTQVTVVARFLAVSTVGILIFWWFWIARRFLNHQYLALWIVLCIFFSGSMTLHYSQLRTEPIAFLFLIAAVLCLAKILVTAGNGKIILFFFAVLFAFLAALNKTQVIFYLPIYFFWAICFFPHQATKKKLPYRHRTQALFTLLGSVVCIYIACKYAIYPSQYFNGAFLLSLYFVIWFYWRNVGGNLSIQINLFNLFFIFIFLLIQFSLKIYGLNALELLKQIQSPLGMLVFSSRNIQGIFATPLSSNTFDFYMTIKYIFNPRGNNGFMYGDSTLNVTHKVLEYINKK